MRNTISVRTLSQIGLLIALAFVLERLVPPVNLLTSRISFAFIPMMICGMFFGPVWGAVAFGISDILGWPIMGLTPIPLILVARIVNGFLFGLFLHRENLKFRSHGIFNALTTQIICGMGLTTLGLSHFLGSPYIPLLISRVPQFIIFVVLQIAAFPVLLKLREALRKAGLAPSLSQ
ncbi:MAG: folate family ECF transporter S component [Oscillospiraceae bacterium]|nr:folate family ECF transporter S component [Oscillospiraceae bacterium]